MKARTFTPEQVDHAFSTIATFAESLAGLFTTMIENASQQEADQLMAAKATAYSIGLIADHMSRDVVIGGVEQWLLGSAFRDAGKVAS